MTKKQSVQTIRYIDDDKDADEENLTLTFNLKNLTQNLTCHISQCTQRSPRSSLPCLKLLLHWMIMMTMHDDHDYFGLDDDILMMFMIGMTHGTI